MVYLARTPEALDFLFAQKIQGVNYIEVSLTRNGLSQYNVRGSYQDNYILVPTLVLLAIEQGIPLLKFHCNMTVLTDSAKGCFEDNPETTTYYFNIDAPDEMAAKEIALLLLKDASCGKSLWSSEIYQE